MRYPAVLRLALFCTVLCGASAAQAVDYVSVGEASAILYDAPSLKAKKLFVVSRYMPFESIVTLDNWVKVRDRTGGLYWLEKHTLTSKKYVVAINPLVDVRAEPDEGAARVCQVRAQVVLEWIETTGTGWIKVRHKDGETGFARSSEVWGE
ncbi:MAG: SH3 domain-containing protein [Nitrosomonadales bacterium]|jgi:SH3-like domain-containing protein